MDHINPTLPSFVHTAAPRLTVTPAAAFVARLLLT
jgi:hypothetical protein